MVRTGREIQLASRPTGWPSLANFRLVDVTVPEPGPGEVLIRNTFMSVDPYMRGRMNDVKSYVPPFALDATLDGGAVGEVIASGSPDRSVGDIVLHNAGWRDYAVLGAKRTLLVDTTLAPASAYLGVLGVTGLTAYVGLTEIAGLKPGDIVFVSGAAGAVGSVAGQIAKLKKAARVVGSAGSAEKVAHLLDLGFDAAFNYHDAPVREQLRAAAPDGIDLYFDNVGGEQLEAAISALRTFGRVALCGAISQYNATEPSPAPRNLTLAVGKQLTLRGFIVTSFGHLRDAFVTEMAGWLATGQIRVEETIVDGLDQAPQAFLDLLGGHNTGKMLVRLS